VILKKEGDRIYSTKNSALFKHCSGGYVSVTEREYPALEQVLLAHGVQYIKVIDEDECEQETVYPFLLQG
jgi:hypothetical protein